MNQIKGKVEDMGNPSYSFMEVLGEGTYGKVYKAWDSVNNRAVAFKRIKQEIKINILH